MKTLGVLVLGAIIALVGQFIISLIKDLRLSISCADLGERFQIVPRKQKLNRFLKKAGSFLGDLSLSGFPEEVSIENALVRREKDSDDSEILDTEINLGLNCLLSWSSWSSANKLKVIRRELFEKIKTFISLSDLAALYAYYEAAELTDQRLSYNNEKEFIVALTVTNDFLKKAEKQQFVSEVKIWLEKESDRLSGKKCLKRSGQVSLIVRNLEVKL